MNTTKLMDMYKTTFQPALSEGVYNVKMVSHEYVSNDTADYIKFTFEVLDGDQKGRKLNENRFEKGFGVMVSHLRQQLGRENEAIKPFEFFNELIEKKTPIKLWVVKNIVKGAPKTNFNFLQPIKEVKPNTTVVEDEVKEEVKEENNTPVEE